MLSDEQLERWTHQGATVSSANTYEIVKNALLSPTSEVSSKSPNIYLQGSYRNSTNIRGDSDVDIVIELESTFKSDLSYLSEKEKELYARSFSDATYTWSHFRNDVLISLQNAFGPNNVISKDKSIKLQPSSNRLACDVVPAITYRLYTSFPTISESKHIDGIAFWTQDSQIIINYPKLHYHFGTDKNSENRTKGNYKPIVRLFKNARNKLIDENVITKEITPSYFLECLLYNVDDNHFSSNLGSSTIAILKSLLSMDLENQMCQNQITKIFGDSIEQWNVQDARTLILKLCDLWLE